MEDFENLDDAKYLSGAEKKAVKEFVEKVYKNNSFILERIKNKKLKLNCEKHNSRKSGNCLESIVLFGSAAKTEQHNDIDIAIFLETVNEHTVDPYTLCDNVVRADVFGPYGILLKNREVAGELIENIIDVNDQKIHYLILPAKIKPGSFGFVENEATVCSMEKIFINSLLKDSIVLYKKEEKEKCRRIDTAYV